MFFFHEITSLSLGLAWLYSDLGKWKLVQQYIEIPANQNYWYSDNAYVSGGMLQYRPVIVSTLSTNIDEYYVVHAGFSQYGSLGIRLNKPTAGTVSMVIAILYQAD